MHHNHWLYYYLFVLVFAAVTFSLYAVLNHEHPLVEHDHEHTHPEAILHGDKVCIEGGGFFPNGMPGPSPFLVCGVIEHFVPEEAVVPAPPEYPEGSHNLDNLTEQGVV